MRKKIITIAAVATASAGLAGVGLAWGSDAPRAPTNPTAQTMSGDMGNMGGGRDAMGRSMGGHMRDADVTKMAKGMGMKLDAASVKQMVRMHNGMDEADAMMQRR